MMTTAVIITIRSSSNKKPHSTAFVQANVQYLAAVPGYHSKHPVLCSLPGLVVQEVHWFPIPDDCADC